MAIALLCLTSCSSGSDRGNTSNNRDRGDGTRIERENDQAERMDTNRDHMDGNTRGNMGRDSLRAQPRPTP